MTHQPKHHTSKSALSFESFGVLVFTSVFLFSHLVFAFPFFNQKYPTNAEIPGFSISNTAEGPTVQLTLSGSFSEENFSESVVIKARIFPIDLTSAENVIEYQVPFRKTAFEQIARASTIKDLIVGPMTVNGATANVTLVGLDQNSANDLIRALREGKYSGAILRVKIGDKELTRILRPIPLGSIKQLGRDIISKQEQVDTASADSTLLMPIKLFDFSSKDENEMQQKFNQFKITFDKIWSQCGIALAVTNYYAQLGDKKQIAADYAHLLEPESIFALRILSRSKKPGIPILAMNNSVAGPVMAAGVAVRREDFDYSFFSTELSQVKEGFAMFDGRFPTRGTIAHEIGHIILSQHHDQEAEHLMSEGQKGTKISDKQCQAARNFINKRFNQEDIKREILSTATPEATETALGAN